MTVDLEGIHHLMPEPFQVDAKNLKDQGQRTPKCSFAMGILMKQHTSVRLIFARLLRLLVLNAAGSSA